MYLFFKIVWRFVGQILYVFVCEDMSKVVKIEFCVATQNENQILLGTGCGQRVVNHNIVNDLLLKYVAFYSFDLLRKKCSNELYEIITCHWTTNASVQPCLRSLVPCIQNSAHTRYMKYWELTWFNYWRKLVSYLKVERFWRQTATHHERNKKIKYRQVISATNKRNHSKIASLQLFARVFKLIPALAALPHEQVATGDVLT